MMPLAIILHVNMRLDNHILTSWILLFLLYCIKYFIGSIIFLKELQRKRKSNILLLLTKNVRIIM